MFKRKAKQKQYHDNIKNLLSELEHYCYINGVCSITFSGLLERLHTIQATMVYTDLQDDSKAIVSDNGSKALLTIADPIPPVTVVLREIDNNL